MSSLTTTSIYTPRSIGLFANGVFTGIGICMNFICVPMLKSSNDPVPLFCKLYERASRAAIFSILVGTSANALCYHRTKDVRFIYTTALTFVSIPFTIMFLAPINNKLFAMEKQGSAYDYKKASQHVEKWNRLQYFRTFTGAAAFVINILYR